MKMMKHKLFVAVLLVLLIVPIVAHAVIAYPGKRVVTLADGSKLTVTLVGDEHMHYYQTQDGRNVRLFDDGSLQEIGKTELSLMLQNARLLREKSNLRRAQRRAPDAGIVPLQGTKKGIVLLVNFSDNAFSIDDPKAYFSDYFNKVNNYDGEMTGSVRDYFLAQSYGKFEVEFDVVGPLTLSKPMEYYGAPSNGGNDAHPGEMIIEACKAANSQINFRDYDWNGDGYVDQVYVVYAGYGENYGAPSTTIWPHESQIPQQLSLDGVNIRTYACSCELRGNGTEAEKVVDGIGTACHEFSHCLGFPDFYNTSTGGRSSLTTWDLLSVGSYNNLCRTPAGYTSYERWQAGWLTPKELVKETDIKDMKPLAESAEAYILYNDQNRNEYFLLENRQQVGFDGGLYGHGLIILHVDYQASSWLDNMVNILSEHERLGLVPADGNDDYSVVGMQGDPFPGRLGNTMFTDLTTPAQTLFNKNSDGTYLLHKSIESIQESDGLISFSVMKPALLPPTPSVSAVGATSFSLSWPKVERATGYELLVTETPAKKSPAESAMLVEDFAGSYKSSNGISDISAQLDNYLTNRGFTGTKLYQSPNLLRIGTGSSAGTLRTPVQRATETGEATVLLIMKPQTEGVAVGAYVNVLTNGKPIERIDFSFDTETAIVLHPTTVLDEIFRVDLYPDSRCYISYLAIFDGNFSEEELGLTEDVAEVRRSVSQRRRVNVQNLTTTEASYTLTDLNPTSLYTVQVRSLDNGRISVWSDPIEIKLGGDDDAIQGVNASQTVKSSGLYDLQGRKVAVPSKSGIYIRDGKKFLAK